MDAYKASEFLHDLVLYLTTPQDASMTVDEAHKASIILDPQCRAMLQAYAAQCHMLSARSAESLVRDTSATRKRPFAT